MGKTILAAGAALACTTFAFADGAVKIETGLNAKTKNLTKNMTKVQKYAANRGGIPGIASADILDRAAGDTISSATLMTGNAWSDTGNTSVLTDDWDETCPDTSPGASPGAPDGFYLWSSTASSTVDVSLCDAFSTYDSKLSVYDASIGVGLGLSIACDDDTCSAGLGLPWVSEIAGFAPGAGSTYYVMVDGWSAGDSGNYRLTVGAGVPCTVTCPTGGLIADNGLCGYTGTANNAFAVDGNNGCFANPADPNEANSLSCGDVWCGTTFLDSTLQLRDLDWFRFDYASTQDVVLSLVSGNPNGIQMFVVTNDGACASLPVLGTISTGTNCTTISLSLIGFTAGTSLFHIVGPFGTDPSLDCPNEQPYVLSVDACLCGPYLAGNIVNTGTSTDVVDVDDLNVVLANFGATCS